MRCSGGQSKSTKIPRRQTAISVILVKVDCIYVYTCPRAIIWMSVRCTYLDILAMYSRNAGERLWGKSRWVIKSDPSSSETTKGWMRPRCDRGTFTLAVSFALTTCISTVWSERKVLITFRIRLSGR